MSVEFDIFGIDELVREAGDASHELDAALDSSVQDAAEKGLVAFTMEHPYEDRTFNLTSSARVEDTTTGVGDGAVRSRDMVWGGDGSAAPYAMYVEGEDADGYKKQSSVGVRKFTPVAKAEAKRVLERDVEYAAELFVQKLNGQ